MAIKNVGGFSAAPGISHFMTKILNRICTENVPILKIITNLEKFIEITDFINYKFGAWNISKIPYA